MRALKNYLWLSLLLVAIPLQAAPTDPGIYAVFETSLGTFTARLDYEKVPRTVANFIGLAEGELTWLDLTNGTLRQDNYFDQLTFHRVSPGFVIQGGSPNGLGTDGPGYLFKDEFHPALRHDKEGMLSMANSGVNTNGSQFFVTLAPAAHLDNLHAVFGEVIEGIEQVRALGNVPVVVDPRTGRKDKPSTPPVIQTIRILRIGEAAESFGPASLEDPLPTLASPPLNVVRLPTGSVEVHWPADANKIEYLFASANLQDWDSAFLQPTGKLFLDNFIAQHPMVILKIIQAERD